MLIRDRQKISPDIVGTAHATETAAQLTLANKQTESNRKLFCALSFTRLVQ